MQVVTDSSSETSKLCCVYMETGIQSQNVNWTPTMERMGQWVQLHVESEMYPNDVAEFLALVSSPTSHVKITTMMNMML